MTDYNCEQPIFNKNKLSLSASVFNYSKTNKNKIHKHNYYQFNYVFTGTALHYCKGKTKELHEGYYFIVPPGIEHTVYTEGLKNVKVYAIDFCLDAICCNNCNKPNDINLNYIDNLFNINKNIITGHKISQNFKNPVVKLLKQIIYDSKNDKKRFLLFRSRFLSLLAILSLDMHNSKSVEKTKKETNSFKKIKRSIEFIDKHFSEKLEFSDICAMTGLSPAYYRRLFKKVTKKTFSRYIISLRINKALSLLITTNMNIQKICDKCGFNNTSHFHRTFKSRIGISPQKYRLIQKQTLKNR